jgi:hypothetical protein
MEMGGSLRGAIPPIRDCSEWVTCSLQHRIVSWMNFFTCFQRNISRPVGFLPGCLAWLSPVVFLFSGGIDSCVGQDPKIDFFESKIRPILVEKCYECHSAKSSDLGGNLRLDAPGLMRRGGTMGPALAVGTADQSLLIRAVEYNDTGLQMPPDGKLTQEQIDDLKKWIGDGAIDPRPELEEAPSASMKLNPQLLSATHWAYQPLAEPSIPAPSGDLSTESDPIDRIVMAKLASHGLSLATEADRRTLVRRLYYDLLGIPPTLGQIQSVEADASPDWYTKLVDGLLQSPHFGERMARRWMDVTRYADNKGYVFVENREYPHAYRYRDWLIRSFNNDLPYDQFVRFQLIGDRLDPQNAEGHLDAMGMLTLGRRFLNNVHDIADDRIDVITRGLLGVTAACARCHDHKFDPVSMADYYSLHAALLGSEEPGGDPSPMRLVDKENQGPTRLLLRGSPGNPGPEVPRRFIAFLTPTNAVEMKTGSGRLEMAEAIVDAKNPLTSRVYVNRIWGWIFGVPLVDTPSDFGVRCEPPVHQGVLDSLAWDFQKQGWSTKQLIRRIVVSRVYRQKSDHRPEAYALDPENRWLWRSQRKRMDFESLRDALLAATGQLDRAVGGTSVNITEPPFPKRRTLYAYIDRQNLPQIFRSFDFASPDSHVPVRPQTTVPQQGLVLMNSDLLQSMLVDIAGRASERGGEAGIEYLFEEILARKCNPQEREWFTALIAANDRSLPDSPQNQWSYGVATYSPETGQIERFRLLPRFVNGRWQGTKDELPDPELDWALLNSTGGHPGARLDQVVVRRWTAFAPATLRIRGNLKHPAEPGNGVRASVVVRGVEKVGEWTVHHGSMETNIDEIVVAPGDTIDFVTDSLGDANSDTFEWKVRLVSNGEGTYKANSERHFSAIQPVTLSPWEQAAQALLLTNEFCFID